MEKIICATHNSGKLREIRSVLEPLGYTVVSASDAGLTDDPEETGVTFVDLHNISADIMDALGRREVKSCYINDHTHTSLRGAQINARCVAKGLRAVGSPLADYLR